MKGILLALQFFTVIPVRKELAMGKREVTAMFVALPFIGGAIGLVMYAVMFLMSDLLNIGMLLTAVFIVLTGILLTGGLHLDGWADTGDAFFSYRDREKRFEILEDPRIGAFGTMALVLLVLLKVALFHELLIRGGGHWALFIAVPFVVRVGMNSYFALVPSAKDGGIASFLKGKLVASKVIIYSLISGLLVLIVLGFLLHTLLIPVSLAALFVLSVTLYRKWSLNHFGGVTGDLSGAFIEGMEAVAWLVVLLLL
ncbi:adenosylcobinamide-GDP ribazoletransferase [Sporosarcina sp. CAU 1771]